MSYVDTDSYVNTECISFNTEANLSKIDLQARHPLNLAVKVFYGPMKAHFAARELQEVRASISALRCGLNKTRKVEWEVFSRTYLNPTPTLIEYDAVAHVHSVYMYASLNVLAQSTFARSRT